MILIFGCAALATMSLVACDLQKSATKGEAKITASSTDDQKFAYMLGAQIGGQNFLMLPRQMGEEMDEDVVFQAVRDGVKSNKDTSFKMQITADTLRAVGARYSHTANGRVQSARPDSATAATVTDFRAYMDSVLKSLPVKKAPEPKGIAVTLSNETATDNQKFSYLIGVQFANQLTQVGEQFQTSFDEEYFILGAKEAHKKNNDSAFVLQMSEDSLKAIGDRYNEKMKTLREEAMKKAQEEEAKLKDAVTALRGDTLVNGMPKLMNFAVPVTGITLSATNLEKFKGKPLLMFYFSTTCGHCRHAAPSIGEIADEFAKDGLTTVTVATGSNNKRGIRSFMEDIKWSDNLNVTWDETRQFGELYSDGYVPKVYVVNQDGTYKLYGSIDSEKDQLKADIKALLAGQKVEWNPEPPKAPATK